MGLLLRNTCGRVRRIQLVDEMSSVDGTEQVVRAFNTVGASAPVSWAGMPLVDGEEYEYDVWVMPSSSDKLLGRRRDQLASDRRPRPRGKETRPALTL